ncbi:MAG: CinA family protein [Oscillospiraceae bacterium]|nr:CinA family protein [Oscillospiraceae bacterium]
MMTHLSCDVLKVLKGKTLVTAESCTGGRIGAALTAIAGSSQIYKGGVICYSNWVKEHILGVTGELLETVGPVSDIVAEELASGVRRILQADVAVSVTGLAGPDTDGSSNPVGTVYIGYEDEHIRTHRKFLFHGNRQQIRDQAVYAALSFILELHTK